MLNQFATPGLGSLLAKRWVAGTGQLVIFLAGFGLYLAWFIRMMKDYYGMMESDSGEPDTQSYAWLWKTGALLAVAAWLWAWVTSLQLLRAAKTPPPELGPKPPPMLPK